MRKMSGATLPIVGDDAETSGPLVLVGRSKLADAMNADIPSGLTPARKEEGFVLLCKGDKLLLAGNDAGPYHGTEYAAAELLERLGVRWFMPSDYGEVVPNLPTLDLPDVEVRQKPDFALRNWWAHANPEMAAQERRWKIRNRMNPDPIFDPPGDSSARNFVADKKLAATEPELFAKNQDGTTNPFMPNLTNPKAVQIAAEKMKEIFRKHPERNSIGIAPDDGLPRDFGPETVKRNQGFYDVLGREGVAAEASVSEEWIAFVNAVAADVAKEFPDRVVTTNGYANRNTPPEGVPVAPNVSIMFAAIWADTLHAMDDPRSWQAVREGQMLKRWAELSDKTWVYGYNHSMLVSALTPVPITRKLARDLPLCKKWGVIGFHDEARNQWAESGTTTKYLRARLEWDTKLDVKATLADYFAKWYGPAAGPAQAFWDALEDAIEATPLLGHEDRILPYVYTPELMEKLRTHIEAAEKLAPGGDAAERLQAARPRRPADLRAPQGLRRHVGRRVRRRLGRGRRPGRRHDGNPPRPVERQPVLPPRLRARARQRPGLRDRHLVLGRHRPRPLLPQAGRPDQRQDRRPRRPAAGEGPIPDRPERRRPLPALVRPGFKADGWKSVLTTKPFYAQGFMTPEGYPYTGYAWYRLETNVPAQFAGKPVTFLAPVVETEAWLWVNGKYVGHRLYKEAYERPNEMELDVTTAVKPGGKNVIVLRVATGLSRSQAAGGLSARPLLYSPKPAPATGPSAGRK